MIVRRAALLAALVLFGVTCLPAAPRAAADPHELYEKARELAAGGDLKGAAGALADLRALIAGRPGWDPEGVFAKRLLPPLAARVGRLQGAARALDEFSELALRGLRPPDIKDDMSTVRDYTDWATSVIQRLRVRRDRLIEGALNDPQERTLLTRTEAYARTERLLETDVLSRLAEMAGDDILGLLTGDPALESILVRFRQIKRELMQIVAERDRLGVELKKARDRGAALLGTLGAMVTDDAPLKAGIVGEAPADIGALFVRFLESEQESLRKRASLGAFERDVLRADLKRYRRYDQALVASGFGSSQSGRIETLAKAVEGLPIEDGILAAAPSAGAVSILLTLALALAAGWLGWLAVHRGRRLASLQGAGGRGAADGVARASESDVGSHAA